jgi:hypothetical protein
VQDDEAVGGHHGRPDEEQTGGQGLPLRNPCEDEEALSTRIEFWQNEPILGDRVFPAADAGMGTSARRVPSAYMLLAAINARSFPPRFSLDPRAQPHTHSAAVLINKHHAGSLQCPADGEIIGQRQ